MGDVLEGQFRENKHFQFDETTTLEELVEFSYELGVLAGERIDEDDPFVKETFKEVVDKVILATVRGWMLRVYAQGVAETRTELEKRLQAHLEGSVSELHSVKDTS